MNRKVVLFDIDHTLFDTEEFKDSLLSKYSLFEGITDLLGELVKNNIKIGIVSQGERDFQIKKIQETGLDKFFSSENIYIVKDKIIEIEEILKLYSSSELYLVDDRLDVLGYAKKNMDSITTIFVKYGKKKITEEVSEFEPDYSVEEVNKIRQIII